MGNPKDSMPFDDDLGDLDLPDFGIPDEDIFSGESIGDDLSENNSDNNIDSDSDISMENDFSDSDEQPSKSEEGKGENKGLMQKIIISFIAIIVMGIMLWPSNDEPDVVSIESSNSPVSNGFKQGDLPTKEGTTIQTKRIKTVVGPDTDFKRAYTLEQINESKNIIEVIEQMKKDLDTLRKTGSARKESLQSFKDSQDTVYKSLAELSRITSAYEVPLDDGGEVRPSSSGFGYTLISGAGIQSNAADGVFIMMKNGYLITNKNDLSMIFVMRGRDAEGKISNIYKISPIHGLMDKSNDTKELKNVLALIKNQNPTSKLVVEAMNNMVLFFNSKGQIAARKLYKNILKDSKRYINEVKGSSRRVIGFETSDFVLYDFSGSLVKIDGIIAKIEGISHGIKAKYVEYAGSVEVEGPKVIEIISDGEVIKRIDITSVESVLLQTATVGKDRYVSKKGNIYMVDIDRQKLLQGPGSILATVEDGQIVGEKIILNESQLKYSNLSSLIGMTLQAKSGKSYRVSIDHLEIMPSGEIKLFDDFLISSRSDLLSKSKIFIDRITRIESTGKVGGRIVTKNSIIEIRNDKEATIISKLDKKTKVYINPKVYFDKEYITIKIPSIHSVDREAKKINGKKYLSEEIVDLDRSRFIMDGGIYFNPTDPVIRVTDVEVLSEKVIDIESISGSVFDYIYYVDEQTGKISASSIGEFKINHSSAKFDVFNDADSKKTIAKVDLIRKKKEVMSFGELIAKNDYFTKVYFNTSSGDIIKVNSPNSIVYNGINLQISSGKYNAKVGLLIISLPDNMASKDRRRLSINSSTSKIERSVASMEYINDSYYDDNVVVLTLDKNNIVIKKDTDAGLSSWTKVYSRDADIFKGVIELTIKAINPIGKPTEKVVLDLNEITNIGDSMKQDMILEYNSWKTQAKSAGQSKSVQQMKAMENRKILQERLQLVTGNINAMLTKGLVINTHQMTTADVEKLKDESKEAGLFAFEVGTELTYTIKKSIEIADGEELYIHTDLDQSYFEDREGNTLEMQTPILVLRVVGDFNKSQIVFSPVEIIYTNYSGIRTILDVPEGSTRMEYTEDDSDYSLSGVPAYYVNQKIRELPTTVMLSTLQGVVDSMTADDPLSSGLEGMQDLVGGGDATTADAFTEGVASGASSGIKEILEVYKAKASGKRDMLISSGDIDLKSLFIRTTQMNAPDGNQ
jgi:hypothetical protein